MTSELTWALLKQTNNRFLVKRDGAQLTSEPFNVKNVNLFKYSGLANSRAVDVRLTADGKRVAFVAKTGSGRRPAKGSYSFELNKARRAGSNRSAELIKKATKSYRADLSSAAIARYHALRRSVGVKPDIKKDLKRRRRGANKKA